MPAIEENEERTVGNFQPDWTGGFSTDFKYKNLRLAASFDFMIGGQMVSWTNMWAAGSGTSKFSAEKNDKGEVGPNRVTDGPYLFRTGIGRLGMIWTSWIYDVYTQGVAYSTSGTLDGPWVQEPDPITPPNFGHGMLFQDLNGQWLMSVHSHRDVGHYIRIPHLFKIDLSGDKLVVGERYIP